MKIEGAVAVVTGAGAGIGKALCERLALEGAAVIAADIDGEAAATTAEAVGGVGMAVDVTDQAAIERLFAHTVGNFGSPDLVFSNAGAGADGGIDAPDAVWDGSWRLNLMSHVYVARAAVPLMLDRKRGHIVVTASAAGLLSMPGAAPYATAKHAAVAFAEYLAIEYGGRGVGVSCLCPQAVDTALLRDRTEPALAARMRAVSQVLPPSEVADATLAAVRDGQFMILPHPEVAEHRRRKVADPDRWIAAMRRWNTAEPER